MCDERAELSSSVFLLFFFSSSSSLDEFLDDERGRQTKKKIAKERNETS